MQNTKSLDMGIIDIIPSNWMDIGGRSMQPIVIP